MALAAWLLCFGASGAYAQDADNDGVPDSVELPYGDSDGDGLDNVHDPDDDNDTRPTRIEEDGTSADRDQDGTPDYLDADEDDDGLALLAEDINGDRLLTELDDTDRDGLIDALDADDDGDGLETRFELGRGGPAAPLDSDGDHLPDYRDPDDDNDGVPTRDERELDPEADGNRDGVVAYLDPLEVGPRKVAMDLDGDGIADDQDLDDDGDTVPDALEQDRDTDGDGLIDRRDADDDGDGVETAREHGSSAAPRNSDGDELPDYLDSDDDDDGVLTRDESPDLNHDGRADDPRRTGLLPDYLNADDDNDGVSTRRERPNGVSVDSDADGIADYRDGDDDGDGVDTNWESPEGVDRDTDADGKPDRLDEDDDGDMLDTRTECAMVSDQDVDDDGLWNCYDLDSDGDGVLDALEGLLDVDEDGIPDFLDNTATPKDSDGDGVADARECELPPLGCPDIDRDGIADYLDADDDGDGLSTLLEEGQRLRDSDADGTPDYLDTDDDDDGVPTRVELGKVEAPRDSDGDNIPDYLDVDDDGDGVLTKVEGGESVDSDADGVPDYLDGSSKGPADAGIAPEGGVLPGNDGGDGGVGPALGVVPVEHDDGCSVGAARAPRSALSWLSLLAFAALLRRRRVWSSLATLLSVGCEDGAEPTVIVLDGGSVLDAQMADRADAQLEGGSDRDSESPTPCMSAELSFLVGDTSARSFSATIDGNRVHLAFIAPSCGGATSSGQGKGVRYVSFTSGGPAGEPLDVDSDVCLPVREPTLLRHGEGQLSLYFGSGRGDQYDLYALTPQAQSMPLAISANAAIEVELSAAALGSTRAPFLAYVPEAALPSTNAASIQLLAASGTTSELLPATLDHHPTKVSLVRREDGASRGRGLVGWVSERGAGAGIHLRHVSEFGEPTGDVVTVTRQVGAHSELSFGLRSAVTGIVFTESPGGDNHQLRYRALGSDGALADARSLTSANQDVRELAVAPYRNGFAVAYRNREPNGELTLRALGLDEQGNTASNATLTDAGGEGTDLQLLQALDGRLIVLWDEPGPPPRAGGLPDFNRRLRVGRVTCF